MDDLFQTIASAISTRGAKATITYRGGPAATGPIRTPKATISYVTPYLLHYRYVLADGSEVTGGLPWGEIMSITVEA